MRAALALVLVACAPKAPRVPVYLADPPTPLVEPLPEPDHPLHTFFAALEAAEAGVPGTVASILHLGASHTASDTFSGPLRAHLQDRFGDAGRGLHHPGRPWRRYRQVDSSYDMDGPWFSDRATLRRAQGVFGLTGVRLDADLPEAWLSRSTCDDCPRGRSFDHWAVHLLARPDGGSVRILVDGEVAAEVPTALSAEEREALGIVDTPEIVVDDDATRTDPTLEGGGDDGGTDDDPDADPVPPPPPEVGRLMIVEGDVPDGPHTVRVEVVGDGPVSVVGIDTTRAVPGVRYAALGINGSRGDQWLGLHPGLVADGLARLQPDLVVLHWGINEAYDERLFPEDLETAGDEAWAEATAAHTQTYVDVLETVRAVAPEASCLLLLPTDLTPTRHPLYDRRLDPCPIEVEHPLAADPVCVRPVPRSAAAITEAQRRAAVEVGCAVWDQQAAMGGAGGSNVWRAVTPRLAGDDGIHLTFRGYAVLADQLYDDLLDAYGRWKVLRSKEAALATTPVALEDLVEVPPDDEVTD